MSHKILTLVFLALMICCSLAIAAKIELPRDVLRGPTAAPISLPADVEPHPQDGERLVALDGDGTFIQEVGLGLAMAPQAEDALLLVPDWLRMDLYDMFVRMSTTQQEDWGQLLLDITDPNIIDEVAFTIAHSSESILTRSDKQLYVKNAELLYQIDAEIAYADIVDHGVPGVDPDYYSMVKYHTIRGGVMDEYELPRDIYYWYIVHPKHGDEDPSMDPAITERTSTYGYLWREYLFYSPSDEYDYTKYYVNKLPNEINDADIDNWGPSATGYLTNGSKSYRAAYMMSGQDEKKPLLCEWPWNMSRVIITTMDAERAYSAGKTKMLENLVMRSNGILSETLTASDWVGVIDDSDDPNIVGPIQEILEDHNIDYGMFSSGDFVIRPWRQCTKVIIASRQPRSFYEALASETVVTHIRDWINSNYVTFQFHGACAPENAWGDLELPFGLGYVAEETNDPTKGHYPTLQEVIGNATHLWDDSVANASLPAFRDFEPDSMAVDVIGNWVARNLPFRARGNRPIQANQICFEHNGNCGEIQDLMNAAARTCLIPCAGVNNHTWDHVSNEFWEQDWHGYQVDWNGNHTSVAKQSVLYDGDFGGGKELSAIPQDRGDTYPVNATSRFSKTCTFIATVEDSRGNPVDGAEINIAVPFYNDISQPLYTAIYAYTDSTGKVAIDLGNKRDFWMGLRSKMGNADLAQILTDTVEYEEYTHTWVVMEGLMPTLPPILNTQFPPGDYEYRLDISYDVEFEMLYSLSGASFGQKENAGNIDFFIADADEYAKYQSDDSFQAHEWREDSSGDSFGVEVPSETLYLVFSNEDTTCVKQFVRITVDVNKKVGGTYQLVESYSKFVSISCRDSFALQFTPAETPSMPPSILAAGHLEADVNSATGFEFGMQALVVDPDGLSDIQSVEVYYSGIPLGIFLTDDGIEPDSFPGDGIFTTLNQMAPNEIAPGRYCVELVATDQAGNKSSSWPYLNVLFGPLAMPGFASQMNTDIWQPAATADGAPVVLGGGFWGTDSVRSGDLINFAVLVSDPDGPSDIDRVELFLEGGVPTGFYLNDDGIDGDDHAGDGIFTFQTVLPYGMATGQMVLEVVAFDNSGNSSATYPYLTVN
ncbi:MAG: transglutaminase domain-containing protein [Candidatus Coatesbacteria bacterium]|nr:transglutaminase domain-containing protein [Candidatus Coatesbacteria bacterium]